MPAAPVSRSSALPEITPPSRRHSARSEPEQAFALPQEPTERPRPRLDDGRGAREGEEAKPDDGVRRTAAAGTGSSGQADGARDRQATDAGDASGKTQAEAPAGQIQAKDAAASEGKATQPAAGETVEQRKAALAVALEEAVTGKETPEDQAAAGAVMQPVPPPAIGAEFLALAAAAPGSETTRPEGTASESGKAAAAAGATGTPAQATGGAIAVPVPPTLPAKADGQPSAGGEAAAADIEAGVTPQLPAAGAEARADGKLDEAKSGDAARTTDARTGEAQAAAKGDSEAGKVAATAAGGDAKAAGDTKAADATVATATAGQTTQAASAETIGGAQQASPPLSPQAILAAGPQSLTSPQAPPTELDAAAQATAHAQAEAAHKLVSGEPARATPLHLVPVEIGARALAGNRRFDIRLDPAELGRIDVSLEISEKGEVSARLTVDRVETLHMLQRDARTLERAFEQAGLKPSEGGIDLSLRDSGDQQAGARQQRPDDEAPRGRRAWVEAAEDSALVTEVASLPRNAGRLGGVDLSI